MPARVETSVLARRLAAALAAPGGPRAGEHLLVAVSGGPDSTALLAALAELAPGHGLRLTAAHVDHGLRGVEGAAEADAVAALAARLGVPFVGQSVAVPAGPDLEARARRARYRALARVAAEVGAGRIVTGHTQDDQVETVLLRLLRGAGRRGLGAMRPARGRLLRPLLAATRADVRRFLGERGVGAVHVARVLGLAAGAERGAVAIPGPARVVREGDVLARRPGRAAAPSSFTLEIAPGRTVAHGAGRWRVTLSAPRARGAGEVRAAGVAHALFDAEALPGGLVLRSPARGDRIRLLAGGTRKLQDILVDAKVPREARALVPVLAAGAEILWVAGLVRGVGSPVGPATTRIVEAVFERDAPPGAPERK